MTCVCGHIKAEHQLNDKFCYLCSCTMFIMDVKKARELMK